MLNVAIVQDGFKREDPLSTLKLVTIPIPQPSSGQVVVHIKLRNIHVFDLLILRASTHCASGLANLRANLTPAYESYGTVHEVGEGITKLHKGQRVIPHTLEAMIMKGNRSWQEYICLDEEYVWPLPNAITDSQAAPLVCKPWTAYSMLKDLKPVPKCKYVVQSAAGSTVGKQVISLTKHSNIKLINVVRRSEQKTLKSQTTSVKAIFVVPANFTLPILFSDFDQNVV